MGSWGGSVREREGSGRGGEGVPTEIVEAVQGGVAPDGGPKVGVGGWGEEGGGAGDPNISRFVFFSRP